MSINTTEIRTSKNLHVEFYFVLKHYIIIMLPEPNALKATFLNEHQQFSEVDEVDELITVGKIEDIDLVDSDVWFLQCPKGMDLKVLEHEKLKIPGRTSLSDVETISVEFVEGKQQQSFAYSNRKGGYDLRLLPVRGTIVVRDRLKASDNVTSERIEECCPPSKRVPMPSAIRVRHPLLGVRYEEKLDLKPDVLHRLKEAEISRKSVAKKSKLSRSQPSASVKIEEISSTDDDEVKLVSEKKRKHKDHKGNDDTTINKKKLKKLKKSDEDVISKDLQWLQDI
ncbi:uncharacterized protein LOC142221397 [Haematobia irritans]|uniref:uncharacterized protein LOC142221397 n=1 Tax=Haematobia irritans TaxID=7368 RepID=UPI003F50BB35